MRDALSDTWAENLAGVPKRRCLRVPPVPRTRTPAPWTRSRREHTSRCGVEAGPLPHRHRTRSASDDPLTAADHR